MPVAHSLLLSISDFRTNVTEHTVQAKVSEAIKYGKKRNNRISVFFIGQDRVGKTSLKKRLLGEEHDENEPSTVGIDFNVVEVHKDEASKPWLPTEEKRLIASEEYMNGVIGKDAARRINEDSKSVDNVKEKKQDKDKEDENMQNENGKNEQDDKEERKLVKYEEKPDRITGKRLLPCSGNWN